MKKDNGIAINQKNVWPCGHIWIHFMLHFLAFQEPVDKQFLLCPFAIDFGHCDASLLFC